MPQIPKLSKNLSFVKKAKRNPKENRKNKRRRKT